MQRVIVLIFILIANLFSNKLTARSKNLVKDVDFSTYALKYKGTLDNHINVSVFLNQENDKIRGIYFYENNKYYLTLDGTIGKTGNCLIFENNYKGKITGKFEGVIKGNKFKGTWKNNDNSKTLNFDLLKEGAVIEENNNSIIATPIEKSENKIEYSIPLFIITLIVAVGGIYYYRKSITKHLSIEEPLKESITKKPLEQEPEIAKPVEIVIQPVVETTPVINQGDKENLSARKGYDFEKFIIDKIPTSYFKCTNWRGDKFTNTHFPISNKYPDMEFEFSCRTYFKKFAIECKYRKNFVGGYVDLCTPEKLLFYKQYQNDNNIEVYIALGVGGEPHQPKDLYLIPLEKINSHQIHSEYLDKGFIKPVQAMFHYKRDKNCLT